MHSLQALVLFYFIMFQLYYYYTFVHTPCAYKNASGDFTWNINKYNNVLCLWNIVESV